MLILYAILLLPTPRITALQTTSMNVPMSLNFKVRKTPGMAVVKEGNKYIGQRHMRRQLSKTVMNSRDAIYLVDVYLGTKMQKVTVILDTGSADLWVPHHAYDPLLSSESYDTGTSFQIEYLDGVSVDGFYYKDDFRLNPDGFALPGLQFCRANIDDIGVLGIGDRNQQVSRKPYDNLPWALQKAGLIPKASYSLFLGPSHQSGTIIFGGIDTEKYLGKLETYAISRHSGGLAIDLESIIIANREFPVNSPVLLDSGTSLSILSGEVLNEMDGLFNTTTFIQDGIEYRVTSCDQPSDKFIHFNFGKNMVSLSYADAVHRQESGVCLLGFAYHKNMQILGDVFLRKAYVYYDLSERTISIAQASYSNKSNIVSA
ncbi:hypothetical protein OXX69_002309 [Metschnikowia pulcherrima]